MAEEKNLSFSMALVRLKKGDEIARASWEKGDHLALAEEDIHRVEPNGDAVIWDADNADILADDWYVSKEAD